MAKENDNKSFILRVDAATMEALEAWAADEFRSINGQVQWIISDALARSGRTPKNAKLKTNDASAETGKREPPVARKTKWEIESGR